MRYYLKEDDYEFLIRIFPKAANLDWEKREEKRIGICRSVDIDPENISSKEKDRLGDDYDECVERLKRQAQTSLSAIHVSPESASRASAEKTEPVAFFCFCAGIWEQGKKAIRLMFHMVFSDIFLIILIIWGANIISEAKGFVRLNQIKASSDIMTEYAALSGSEQKRHEAASENADDQKKPEKVRSASKNETPADDDMVKSKENPEEIYDFMQLVKKTIHIPTESKDPWILERLNKCEEHLNAYRLTTGAGETALKCYRWVLEQSPGNIEAYAGLKKIEVQYIQWAERALQSKNLKKAEQYLESLELVNPESSDLIILKQEWKRLKDSSGIEG